MVGLLSCSVSGSPPRIEALRREIAIDCEKKIATQAFVRDFSGPALWKGRSGAAPGRGRRETMMPSQQMPQSTLQRVLKTE